MYPDLSAFHAPVSDIFTRPSAAADWKQHMLNEKQLSFFHEYGYVSGIKLLEEWQVDLLNEELADIVKPEHPGNGLFHEFYSNASTDADNVLFHALGAWRITKGFHDILWNPAFLMPASQLLGNRSVRFWHDQLFCKPAKHGGVVAWHQDYSYWTRSVPVQHLTCWVGLDDATTENGCLHYVPGSHRWGLLQKPELAGEMEGLMDFLNDEQKAAFKPIPIELKKGYASFHHPMLVHGSYENRSDRPRRAFVTNVFADGTLSDADQELMPGTPPVPRGEKIQGRFFPLLLNVKDLEEA
ncbi:phytanoyl-CoA dioxygenase family protein [Chitinophaga alhagiae]|uniref:phytanoyl-CoA dioxygenase family protein n=1 Tax=Chitinophaga alhagiae TaxID=2203219 RepID=UPI000E5C38CE|nr:phytanoyl-CoA dioxygenase family protein [Chitinophaga alhagiae]